MAIDRSRIRVKAFAVLLDETGTRHAISRMSTTEHPVLHRPLGGSVELGERSVKNGTGKIFGHNHQWEFDTLVTNPETGETTTAWEVIVENTDPRWVTFQLDVFWAADAGADVVLVERYGFAGGSSTGVLDTFYGFFTPGPSPRKVVGGVAGRVVDALAGLDAIYLRPNTYGAGTGVTFAHYPPTVERVLAVEPEPHLRELAVAAAERAGAPEAVSGTVALMNVLEVPRGGGRRGATPTIGRRHPFCNHNIQRRE